MQKLVQAVAATALLLVPTLASADDMTGFYGGLSLGREGIFEKDTVGGQKRGTGTDYGVFGGYNFDFGNNVVAGVEGSYGASDALLNNGASLDRVARLKGRLGYKIGEGLAYGVVGYGQGKTKANGDGKGAVYGVGYEHSLSESAFIGAEYLHQNYKGFSGGVGKTKSDEVSLKIGMRF